MDQPEWMQNPPETLEAKIALLQRKSHYLNTKGRRGKFLRSLLKSVNKDWQAVSDEAKAQDPLQFFKPSYDQALMLNSWMYGIAFNCVYTANRIGKTTIMIIDKILWILPNSPDWLKPGGIFHPYVIGDPTHDPEGADNPRADSLVEVFPRPSIEWLPKIHQAIVTNGLSPDPMLPHYHPTNQKVLQLLQSLLPEAYTSAYPYAPFNRGGEIWMGAPDQSHHENIVMPLWKQYLPRRVIDREAFSTREFTFKIEGPKRTTYWEWIGKSYESKDTKWSGKAVEIICLTEGVTPAIMREVKVRFTDPGVGSHDFTPYEAANVGGAEALAKAIKTGREKMPLPTFVFTGFSVYNAPTHILPANKRRGLIEAFQNSPEGKARLDGEFYTSSGLILANLSRDIHLLDWSLPQLLQKYPTARLYRGLDPGYDHATAVVWAAILPSNQWVVYRIMSERGLDIPTRCRKIITLSNNTPIKHKFGPKPDQFYIVEANNSPQSEIYNGTICDFHTFKEDETTGQAYSLNYITNGLSIIESTHMGPEDRAQRADSLLAPSPFYPALHEMQNAENTMSIPPSAGGAQLYFLQNGPGVMAFFQQMEEFYWERQKGGENKGLPKDKVPSHGDDELDALCYIIASPFRWTSHRPPPRVAQAGEQPERHLQSATEAKQTATNSQALDHLQQLQSTQAGVGAGHFGSPESDDFDDDLPPIY